MSSSSSDSNSNTVILGSGIIGVSAAYYLSQSGNTDPKSIHLVDTAADLFRCASGLAAGFIAADWFAPSVAPLGQLSFKLHKQLAEAHNGRKTWGYSASTGISLSQDGGESAVGGSGEDWLSNGTSRAQAATPRRSTEEAKSIGPKWLKDLEHATLEVISNGTTAQIDPLRFCQWLLKQCQDRGVQLHCPAKATGVCKDETGQLTAVKISQNGGDIELPCTRLVIAAGAWSPRLFSTLFPSATTRLPIYPLAGHSILLRNPFYNPEEEDKEVCHAVFATDTLGFSPEWFARVPGELYLAGLNSTTIKLPENASDAKAKPEAADQLKECATSMMATVPGKNIEVIREGLCFRPVTSSGRPIVSRIPDAKLGGIKTRGGGQGGIFVAAGHGAWGISHAPGTGFILSELLEGRPTSANVEALVLQT